MPLPVRTTPGIAPIGGRATTLEVDSSRRFFGFPLFSTESDDQSLVFLESHERLQDRTYMILIEANVEPQSPTALVQRADKFGQETRLRMQELFLRTKIREGFEMGQANGILKGSCSVITRKSGGPRPRRITSTRRISTGVAAFLSWEKGRILR